MATHAGGIQMSAGSIDGDGDQFEGLGVQNPLANRVRGHAEKLFHPLRVQLGQRVPGGIPAAGVTHGIAGWGARVGLFFIHLQFLKVEWLLSTLTLPVPSGLTPGGSGVTSRDTCNVRVIAQ
ncbi:hypothetical protein D3C80_1153010 [compost metagenome]